MYPGNKKSPRGKVLLREHCFSFAYEEFTAISRKVVAWKRFFELSIACEQALLFGRVKRVSRERASERRTSLARFCEAFFACPNRRACSRAKSSKSFRSEQNFPPKIVEHPIDSQVLDRTFWPASKLSIWGISWKVGAREAREKRRESGGWGRERPFLSHSRGSIGELAWRLRTV